MFRAPLRNEKGQSIIIIAIILVVLIALIALVIDVGNAYAQKRIVQAAVDAAALAATRELADGGTYSSIISVGREFVAKNGADPDSMEIWLTDDEGNILLDDPIRPSGSSPPDKIDGVPVRGIYLTAGKDFQTFFAGVVGRNLLKTSAPGVGLILKGPCAVTGGLFPIAVNVNVFNTFDTDEDTGDITNIDSEVHRLWDKDNANVGNFGWLTWDNPPSNGNPSNQTLVSNMNDTSRSGPLAQGDTVSGSTGIQNSSQAREAMNARINDSPDRPAKVYLPIYDTVEGEGNNLRYHIVGFAAFWLTDYNFHGNDKWVEGYFVDTDMPYATEATCSYFGLKVVKQRTSLEVVRAVVGTVSAAQLIPEKRGAPGEHVPVDVMNVMDVSGSMAYTWGYGRLRENKLNSAKRVLAGDGTGPDNPDCSTDYDPDDSSTWFDRVNSVSKMNECMRGINNYLDPAGGDQAGLAIYPRYGNRAYKVNPRYRTTCGSWHNYWYYGKLMKNLTADIQDVNAEVYDMSANGGTPMADGARAGRLALFDPQFHKLENVPVLIVATDGMCNATLDGKWTGYQGVNPSGMGGCNALAEIQAVDQANLAKQEGGIVFTIAIGDGFGGEVLMNMATAPAVDPYPDDGKDEAHFFQASDPKGLATIYDSIAKRVENIADECIARQVLVSADRARVQLWENNQLASDEDGNALDTYSTRSGSFIFKKVPAGTYEIRATWTDENGIVYDVQTESLGGQEMEDPPYVTVEVPPGTTTLYRDVYLKTSQIPTCDD